MMREHLAHPKRRRAVIALTLLTCVWGTTFAIVQHAFEDVTPLFFAALRFGISLAIFLALFPAGRKGFKLLLAPWDDDSRALRKLSVVLGLTLGIGYIFQFLGLVTTTTSKSAFLTATTILWTPIFARLAGSEKFTARKIITVAASIGGIVLLIHPFPVDKIVIGDVYSALCAVSFGVYILWLDKTAPVAQRVAHSETGAAIVMAAAQLAVALATILVFIPFVETPQITFTGNAVFAILYTAILATAISTFAQAYFQKEITPTAATLIYTLEPVVTALIGYMILGERMSPGELAGCGLIVGAMVVGQF